MVGKADNPKIATIPGEWHISYEYSVGRVAAHFFEALRVEEKILGVQCPQCDRVMVPPRSFCERCFVDADEWVEVGPRGQVVTFTVNHRRFAGIDREPPFAVGLIRLDGADTNMIHLLDGLDMDDPVRALGRVRAGLEVSAQFRPTSERVGSIRDIASFTAIDQF